MILFSSALEFTDKKYIKMNKFIIDVTSKDIFLMIIADKKNYSVSHENSKINYEKLIILINNFLNINRLKINDISKIYINNGPGSFSTIRVALAVAKGIKISNNVNLFGFKDEDLLQFNLENIEVLINKNLIEKKLIKPLYLS